MCIRDRCWSGSNQYSFGSVFWRLDKGISKAQSCCFIVISSGSICRNQSVCAVSYTHLDVYKRQLVCKAGRLLPSEKEKPIGIWGQRHLQYLKEYKQFVYLNLLTKRQI